VDVGGLAELRPRLTDLSQQLDQLVEELT
jgi:hypothetical protein